MERLTEKKERYIHIVGSNTDISTACNLPVFECVIRLTEYEDTGLTPEEIDRLKEQRQNDITELQDLSFSLIEVHEEKDYWEREAKKWCDQLSELRYKIKQQICEACPDEDASKCNGCNK